MGAQISLKISGCSSDRFVRISGLVNYSVDNINYDIDDLLCLRLKKLILRDLERTSLKINVKLNYQILDFEKFSKRA